MNKSVLVPNFYLISSDPDRENTEDYLRNHFQPDQFYTSGKPGTDNEAAAFMPQRRELHCIQALKTYDEEGSTDKVDSSNLPFLQSLGKQSGHQVSNKIVEPEIPLKQNDGLDDSGSIDESSDSQSSKDSLINSVSATSSSPPSEGSLSDSLSAGSCNLVPNSNNAALLP